MAMEEAKIPLTRAAYDELQRELEQLRTGGRQQVAEQLRAARESELDQDEDVVPALEAARESQSFLEGRIQQLEQALATATIIDEEAVQRGDTVQLGSVVVVEQGGRERTYQIVSAIEADAGAGKISDASPIGAALLGRRVGEVVSVEAPAGRLRLRITALR
jgi:transcription elongation factor GreA